MNFLDNFERHGKSAFCKICQTHIQINTKKSGLQKLKLHFGIHEKAQIEKKRQESIKLQLSNEFICEFTPGKIGFMKQLEKNGYCNCNLRSPISPIECYLVTKNIGEGQTYCDSKIRPFDEIEVAKMIRRAEYEVENCDYPNEEPNSYSSISNTRHLIQFCIGILFRRRNCYKFAIECFEQSLNDIKLEFLEEVGVMFLHLQGDSIVF